MDKIQIPKPELFSFGECLHFLDRGFDECLHTIEGRKVYKAIRSGNDHLLFSVAESGDFLTVEVLQGREKSSVIEFTQRWFDLNTRLGPFYKLLRSEKKLAYMAKKYRGLRLMGIPDLFESLCWCIIGQQINLHFAYTMKRRLVERFGESIEHGGRKFYLFPRPEVVKDIPTEELRAMQYSNGKAVYMKGVAEAFYRGELSESLLREKPGVEDKLTFLKSFKGVGDWTANYVLMKNLKEPTAFPTGDAGLLNALLEHDLIKTKKDTRSIDKLRRKFGGYEAYLTLYLWRSLS